MLLVDVRDAQDRDNNVMYCSKQKQEKIISCSNLGAGGKFVPLEQCVKVISRPHAIIYLYIIYMPYNNAIFVFLIGQDLIKDLKSELSGNVEELILALFMPRTYYDAWSLRHAMKVWFCEQNSLKLSKNAHSRKQNTWSLHCWKILGWKANVGTVEIRALFCCMCQYCRIGQFASAAQQGMKATGWNFILCPSLGGSFC